jgi:hypothetical protein
MASTTKRPRDNDDGDESEEDDLLDATVLEAELEETRVDPTAKLRRATHKGNKWGSYCPITGDSVSVRLEALKKQAVLEPVVDTAAVAAGVMTDSVGATVRTAAGRARVQYLSGDLSGRAHGQYIQEFGRIENYIMLMDGALAENTKQLRLLFRGETNIDPLIIRVPIVNVSRDHNRTLKIGMRVTAHPQTDAIEPTALSFTV